MEHDEETPTAGTGGEESGAPAEDTAPIAPTPGESTPPYGMPTWPTVQPPPAPPHSLSAWGGYSGSPPGGPPSWAPPAPPAPPARHRFNGQSFLVLIALVALLAGGLGAALDAVFNSSSPANIAGSGTPTSIATLPASGSAPLASSSKSVAVVANAVEPAIVDINTTVVSQIGTGGETGAGTGMIITRSGEVLTNNHVVEDASTIKVTIPRRGVYSAQVIGVDPTQDVALLQIVAPPSGLPIVHFGDSSNVKVGASVVAIGNAMGLGGKPTVTSGTITAVGRTITAGDELSPTATETLHNLFETDAPIESGDSGGPLVNLRGQVIAMDTAASSSVNGSLGFAIPVNEIHSIVLLIEHGQSNGKIIIGETAFLGVCEQCATSFFFPGTSIGSTGNGVQIQGVISGSPAANAGLQSGDTITAIDGTSTGSYLALQNAIRAHKPGSSVSVTYLDQNGASHTVNITLTGIPL